MIHVVAGTYREFQNFMQEFHLREHFGGCHGPTCSHTGCKEGQVRYIGEPYDRYLRGTSHALVLAWGNWFERRDAREIEDYCKARDIPLLTVPEPKRERYAREQWLKQRSLMW